MSISLTRTLSHLNRIDVIFKLSDCIDTHRTNLSSCIELFRADRNCLKQSGNRYDRNNIINVVFSLWYNCSDSNF